MIYSLSSVMPPLYGRSTESQTMLMINPNSYFVVYVKKLEQTVKQPDKHANLVLLATNKAQKPPAGATKRKTMSSYAIPKNVKHLKYDDNKLSNQPFHVSDNTKTIHNLLLCYSGTKIFPASTLPCKKGTVKTGDLS